MHRFAALALLSFACGRALASDALFAVVQNGESGNPLISARADSSAAAYRKDLNGALLAWRRCSQVRAVDAKFQKLELRLQGVEEPKGDLGESILRFELLSTKSSEFPWLVWCGTANPVPVQSRAASQEELAKAKVRIKTLEVARKVIAGSSERSKEAWTLGPTSARVVDGNILVASTPVRFKSGDERGYVFQAFDMPKQRLLWVAFGHPEWSSSANDIKEVSGQVFFRLRDQGEILMLGAYGFGWESTASAVYRLRDGSALSVAQ
jgi:hypothetical protein